MENFYPQVVISYLMRIAAYGGGSVVIAYCALRFFAKRWLESRFEKQLEHFRHEQAMELAKLKVKIDAALNASVRLQEREFLLLPDAWTKLHAAYKNCIKVANPDTVPSQLENFSVQEFGEYLAHCPLTPTEQADLLIVPQSDRRQSFMALYIPRLFRKAEESCEEFAVFMAANGIFFPQELKEKLRMSAMRLQNQLFYFKTAFEARDFKNMHQIFTTMCDEVGPLHEDLEALIEERLRSHSKAEQS